MGSSVGMSVWAVRLVLGLGLLACVCATSLDPNCAPGGNFNLTMWNLQLPYGSTGHPTTISSSDLVGCDGYENYSYFFTESGDGALVMKVCGSPDSCGCVTTSHSKHCRTELREISPSSWNPWDSTNRLQATLIAWPDDSHYETVVGQIHIDDSVSSKPVCELYYNKAGNLTMGVEQTRAGGDSVFTYLDNVPVGNKFSYEIRYENNVLQVAINGNFRTLSTYQLDAPPSYFKAGNYNQGSSSSDTHFFIINVQ